MAHYRYSWDPAKAIENETKHGVSFQDGATVFAREPQLTLYDDGHSDEEDRWLTMGLDHRGRLLVVCHTSSDQTTETSLIRIISVRLATQSEARQFKELTS